jgi:hypothetical protein
MIFEDLTPDELVAEISSISALLKLAEESRDYIGAYQYSQILDKLRSRIVEPEKLSEKLKRIEMPDDSVNRIHRNGESADFGNSIPIDFVITLLAALIFIGLLLV